MLSPPAIYSIAGLVGLAIISLTVLPIILDRTVDAELKAERAASRADRAATKARRMADKEAARLGGLDGASEPLKLGGKEHLRCPNCAHVFTVETPKNTKDWTRGVAFGCPECGEKGVLPPRNATPVEAVIPAGETVARRFHCGSCSAEWSVGVIGHRLKKNPEFEACPSCGEAGHIHTA
jgi:rubrerythrin